MCKTAPDSGVLDFKFSINSFNFCLSLNPVRLMEKLSFAFSGLSCFAESTLWSTGPDRHRR